MLTRKMVFVLLFAIVQIFAGFFGIIDSAFCQQQAYPDREIQLIVGFAPGGGTDVVARVLADSMKQILKQPVVVMSKPGGGGILGLQQLVHSAPDGYTLMFSSATPITGKYTEKSAPTLDDIEVIAMVNLDPSVVFVKPDSTYTSLKQFFSDAKARPGVVTVGHAGVGGSYHLNALAWQIVSGAQFKFVPFKGGAEIYPALAGKHIEAGSGSFPDAQELLRAQKIKAIGVAGPVRDPNFPNVPTFKEQGFDWVGGTYRFLIGPKGLSPAVLDKIGKAVASAMQAEEVKKFWKVSGYGEFYMNRSKAIDYLRNEEKMTAEAYKMISTK